MNKEHAAEQARDNAREYAKLVIPTLGSAPIIEEDRQDFEAALGVDLSIAGTVRVTTAGLDLPVPEGETRAAVAELSMTRLADLGVDAETIAHGQDRSVGHFHAKTERLRRVQSLTPGRLLRLMWRSHIATALGALDQLPVADETYRWVRRSLLRLAGVAGLQDGFYISEEVGQSGKVGAIIVEDDSKDRAAEGATDLLRRRETIAAWAWDSIVDDEDGGPDAEPDPVPKFRRAVEAKNKAKADTAKEAQAQRDRERAEKAEADRKASRERVEALRARKRAEQRAKSARTREEKEAELERAVAKLKPRANELDDRELG